MTNTELNDLITARAGTDPAFAQLVAVRNDTGIAEALSVGRTRLTTNVLTERGIVSALGPVAGAAFINALYAFAAAPASGPLAAEHPGIKIMVAWLAPAGLDVGDALTQQLLDALAATGVLASASVATIKQLAVLPDPISTNSVSEALNG